jgi:hypothetical protein
MKLLSNFLEYVIDLLNLQIKSSDGGEKEQIITAKNAYEWFLNESKDIHSKRVELTIDPRLLPGKIYVFRYKAKYKNILDYWDKHPIVLVLGNIMGAKGKLVLGINISWYPPSARKYIVEKIREIYSQKYKESILKKGFQANSQSPVYMDLYNLKTVLDQFGFSFAIRTYIPDLIISPKYCICYEDWDKAILLDQPRIFPELVANDSFYSLRNIYEEFKNHVIYQKQNRADLKRKIDEAKAKGKYKFIK